MPTPEKRKEITVIDKARELDQRGATALELFRPQPHQEEFFTSDATEILLGGGNRSGKTLCAAAWFAAYVQDKPITFRDGRKFYPRRAHQRNRKLTFWLVCYDWNYVGSTMYRVLFEEGQFKKILDKETLRWVAYDPTNPEHKARELEARPAPPFIPQSAMIPRDEWSWENRKDLQFKRADAKDGSFSIFVYPSSQKEAKAGDPVDCIWIDENIQYEKHYSEYQARLSDYRGRLLWTTWSKVGSVALLRQREKAKIQKELPREKRVIEHFVFEFNKNAFIPDESKADRAAGWSDSERRQRDLGEFIDDDYLMYFAFNVKTHEAVPDHQELDDQVAKAIRENNGAIPANWRRDLILDPGTAHPAVLLVATPPPSLGECYVAYDEIYPGRATADDVARIIMDRHKGEIFQTFIIDNHAARRTPEGFNMTIGDNYSSVFGKHGLKCCETGTYFLPGSDNIPIRCQMLLDALLIRSDGRPKFRVISRQCPNLVKQLQECMRATDSDGHALDVPAKGQQIDVLQCAEYFVSRRVKYIVPKRETVDENPFLDRIKRMEDMFATLAHNRGGNDREMVSFGPPSSRN